MAITSACWPAIRARRPTSSSSTSRPSLRARSTTPCCCRRSTMRSATAWSSACRRTKKRPSSMRRGSCCRTPRSRSGACSPEPPAPPDRSTASRTARTAARAGLRDQRRRRRARARDARPSAGRSANRRRDHQDAPAGLGTGVARAERRVSRSCASPICHPARRRRRAISSRGSAPRCPTCESWSVAGHRRRWPTRARRRCGMPGRISWPRRCWKAGRTLGGLVEIPRIPVPQTTRFATLARRDISRRHSSLRPLLCTRRLGQRSRSAA